MAKQTAADANLNVLTADEVRRGVVKSTTVDGLTEDGRPRIIYYKSPPASLTMDFLSTPDTNDDSEAGNRARYERLEKMVNLAASSLATPNGELMFTPDEMREVPIDSIVAIVGAISVARSAEGNVSSEAADSSASPTDSLEN